MEGTGRAIAEGADTRSHEAAAKGETHQMPKNGAASKRRRLWCADRRPTVAEPAWRQRLSAQGGDRSSESSEGDRTRTAGWADGETKWADLPDGFAAGGWLWPNNSVVVGEVAAEEKRGLAGGGENLLTARPIRLGLAHQAYRSRDAQRTHSQHTAHCLQHHTAHSGITTLQSTGFAYLLEYMYAHTCSVCASRRLTWACVRPAELGLPPPERVWRAQICLKQAQRLDTCIHTGTRRHAHPALTWSYLDGSPIFSCQTARLCGPGALRCAPGLRCRLTRECAGAMAAFCISPCAVWMDAWPGIY